MKVYIVEGGEYDDKRIMAVCVTKEKAEEKKEEWNKNNSYQGAVIPAYRGGDGIKRYLINDARITEYEVE
jgi:hypothetical protein